VYGLQPIAVKADVDPPRRSAVQKEWDQDAVGAAPPLIEVVVALDGVDRARRRNRLPVVAEPLDVKREDFAPSPYGVVNCVPHRHTARKVGKADPVSGFVPVDE